MTWLGWNYGDIFDAVSRVTPPEQPALIHGARAIAWGEFDRRTNNLARALLAGGASPGDKIAFYARNHAAYLEGVVAAFKSRLVHVNVNYRYVANEVRYIVENSDATVLVFSREFAPILEEIRPLVPDVRQWICIDDCSAAPQPEFAASIEELASVGAGEPLQITRSPDDVFLLYTGGTTGMPKGVIWRHHAMRCALLVSAGQPVDKPKDLDEHIQLLKVGGRGPVSLPACPLMHGTGVFTAISALIAGGTVVTLPSTRFDTIELWGAVSKCRVQQIVIVGDPFAKPLLRALDADPSRFDLECVQAILSSGAMFSTEVKRGLLKHMPAAVLLDSFGSSESVGFGLSTMTADGESQTAQFQIRDNVKVFTPEGRLVAPGSGEAGLIARGEPISEGYYKDQKKTDDTFKFFGGVRYSVPGDFCIVAADGTITLLGRGSGCINTAGEKVFSEEVEEVLKLHPDIDDALVVGVPDEKWGEAVAGLIELREGSELDEKSVREHVRRHLASYKTPKLLITVPIMLRAANGKADYPSALALALRSINTSSS